jgi:ABC-type glycerol-3-phosphate transport system substrate-binding protein
LINGLVNMQTEGDWFFGWYDKVPGFRWDVVPMPISPKTKKTASIANMRGVVLSPLAQNRDLAWAWIARLLSRDVQDRIPAEMGELPARTDSIDQVYLNPTKAPTPKSRRLLKAAIDATVPLPGHPLLPWSGDGSVNGTANVADVYDGKKEAKAALADIQDKFNALIGAKR